MPYIMNALNETVSVQAHGNWFSFKPMEIKMLHNAKLAEFLHQYRGENGLVEVPETLMEMDKTTQEYRDAIQEKRKEGITKYIAKQQFIINNLEVSMRRDYEQSGQKGNYLGQASKGELAAYNQLAKYKEFEAEQQINIAEEIQKVKDRIYGSGNSTNTGKTDSGSPDSVKPTQSRK